LIRLTPLERRVLVAVAEAQPATFVELLARLGLSSIGSVFGVVDGLRIRGLLARPGKRHSRALSLAAGIVVSQRGEIGSFRAL